MTKRPTRPRRVRAGAVTLPLILSFPSDTPTKPFWYLPRTAADYDAMVEQMDNAIGSIGYRTEAIRALRAIGIRRPLK